MVTIDVKGTIIPQEDAWIYDFLDYPYTTAKQVNEQLANANGQDVEVKINSPGGSVYDASEIYTALKQYKGNVTTDIVGLAASAVSVVAMGGKIVRISPTGQIMIHNASMGAQGDYRDMNKAAEILQSVNKSIANAYKAKTGMTDDELKQIMDNETWLTADEAKEIGLVDEIMFQNSTSTNNFSFTNSLQMPSQKAINELRKCGSVEAFKENLIKNKQKEAKLVKNQVLKNQSCQCSGCSQNADDCKCADCGQCPDCCDNPQQCGCGCDQENCSKCNVDNCNSKKIKNNGGKRMDLQTFKNENKDIYDQIVNEAIQNERERIKDIEDLGMPGNEDIINKAKFETGATAENVAMEIIKAQKQKGISYLENVKKDAEDSKINDVKEIPVDSKSKEENRKEAASLIANAANNIRR